MRMKFSASKCGLKWGLVLSPTKKSIRIQPFIYDQHDSGKLRLRRIKKLMQDDG